MLSEPLRVLMRGGEVSDVQWRDILGLLKVGHPDLDLDYARTIAVQTGLASLLERALSQSGLRG